MTNNEISDSFALLPIGDGFICPDRLSDKRKYRWDADEPTYGDSCISFSKNINRDYRNTLPNCRGYNLCGYNRYIHSMVCVIDKETVYFSIETKDGLKARVAKSTPGWYWNIDDVGFRIVNSDNDDIDYHPSANEVVEHFDSIGSYLASIAKDNYNRRKREERRIQCMINSAVLDGVCVTIQDSLNSKNCEVGTLCFINHFYPGRKHLTVSEVWSIMDRVKSTIHNRVHLTIAQAIRRHRDDCARGYCTL